MSKTKFNKNVLNDCIKSESKSKLLTDIEDKCKKDNEQSANNEKELNETANRCLGKDYSECSDMSQSALSISKRLLDFANRNK